MDVWYVSYGSNISENRFSCYIEGGIPEGSEKEEKGCENTTPPKKVKSRAPLSSLFYKGKKQMGQGRSCLHWT